MAHQGGTVALVLYLGWGIATSPLPLAGLAVMLLSDRARRTATVFTGVWFACQLVAIGVFTAAAHLLVRLDLSSRTKHDVAVAMLVVAAVMIVAGVALMVRERRHPKPSTGASTREFLQRAGNAGAREAAGMAFATAVLNITNVPYWAAIGLVIERSHAGIGERSALVLMAAVAASSTFLLATVMLFALGSRLTPALRWCRDTLVKHSGSVVPGLLIMSGTVIGLLAASDLGWL